MLTFIVTGAVVLTCFSSNVLLAFWAATSKWHWSIRAGLFVAVLSLSLLIPAYEVFVAFAIQGMVIAAGVQFTRRRGRSIHDDEPAAPRYRFSLLSCLLATVFVAIAIAVAIHAPFRRYSCSYWIGEFSEEVS